MSVTIVEKGESVQLRGKNTVQQAMVGLGWDPNEGQSQHAFDLDASVVARDANGVTKHVCYYGALKVGDWLQHTGDNLTGQGEGDDEQIKVDLGKVPAEVEILDVVVNIYQGAQRGQSFGMVEGAFARLVNEASGQETIRYNLMETAAFNETGLHLARIRRDGPTWSFQAPDKPFDPAYNDLNSFSQTALP